MSRNARSKQRLRLHEKGNDRCPICLTAFTREDVERGEKARIEHVPPKSFRIGSVAMCLTCVDCNHGASEAERAVAEELRARTDGRWVTLSVLGSRNCRDV